MCFPFHLTSSVNPLSCYNNLLSSSTFSLSPLCLFGPESGLPFFSASSVYLSSISWHHFSTEGTIWILLLVLKLIYYQYPCFLRASLLAQSIKSLSAVQETQVWFLCWEDPLEKESATHSSILAWRMPWTEKPGRLQSMGLQESDTTKHAQHSMLDYIAHMRLSTLSKDNDFTEFTTLHTTFYRVRCSSDCKLYISPRLSKFNSKIPSGTWLDPNKEGQGVSDKVVCVYYRICTYTVRVCVHVQSCSAPLSQGLNPGLLHWQADSYIKPYTKGLTLSGLILSEFY